MPCIASLTVLKIFPGPILGEPFHHRTLFHFFVALSFWATAFSVCDKEMASGTRNAHMDAAQPVSVLKNQHSFQVMVQEHHLSPYLPRESTLLPLQYFRNLVQPFCPCDFTGRLASSFTLPRSAFFSTNNPTTSTLPSLSATCNSSPPCLPPLSLTSAPASTSIHNISALPVFTAL